MGDRNLQLVGYYGLAFTLRSGSNLLCDNLTANGLGGLAEYFQYPFGVANRWCYDALGVAPDDFAGFLQALPQGMSHNGWFAFKCAWDHKNALLEEVGRHQPGLLEMEAVFPGLKWVYLTRRDKVAQAISLVKAIQTGSWASVEAPQRAEVEYDFFELLARLQAILTEELLWDHYFESRNLPVLRLTYEDFIANPRQMILQVYTHIHLEGTVPPSIDEIVLADLLKPQRDQLTARWRERFLEDLYQIGAASHWQGRQGQLEAWGRFFGDKLWRA